MAQYGWPILYSVFVWWFSTGAILYLDLRPRHTFRWSMLGATVVFTVALYGIAATADQTTVSAAYCAFTCGLLAWGWQEISFYMGFVTGPRRVACAEDCRGWKHFVHAVETLLWHELSIIATAAVIAYLTWNAPNQVGFWTFTILWIMRTSAKLNVFFGARNLSKEFLPAHLRYLSAYLNERPMNLFFPVSVTLGTIATAMLIDRAGADAVSPADAAGYTFLATILGLAVLEHWLLMLPLPVSAPWNWSLKSRAQQAPSDEQGTPIKSGKLNTSMVRPGIERPVTMPIT